jgi:hypothetical protein
MRVMEDNSVTDRTTLPVATIELAEGVLALLRLRLDDALYYEARRRALDLCGVALEAARATLEAVGDARAAQVSVTVPRREIGPRIAELHFAGHCVRQIARVLGQELLHSRAPMSLGWRRSKCRMNRLVQST